MCCHASSVYLTHSQDWDYICKAELKVVTSKVTEIPQRSEHADGKLKVRKCFRQSTSGADSFYSDKKLSRVLRQKEVEWEEKKIA